jgi:hypothetical protein
MLAMTQMERSLVQDAINEFEGKGANGERELKEYNKTDYGKKEVYYGNKGGYN